MIAIESFKRFTLYDIALVVLFACIWYLVNLALDTWVSVEYSFAVILLPLTFLMSFVVHIIRKAGTATMFYLLAALLTLHIDGLGV
ncbi:hypothetical protein GF351_00840, partial [Candidatus Woesearchaeota archaeon]|nr:hypothetical protein [Candidatus Woesearchaeota archaeon]